MNVLMYLKHFPATGAPLRVSTNKAVHGLAAGLAANGADVTVLCEGHIEAARTTEAGYTIRCFATEAPYYTLRVAPGLRTFVGTAVRRPALAVLNGIFHPSVYALSRQLRKHDIPYIVAPHGPYHPLLFRKRPFLKWPYWYLLERRLLKQARAIQFLDARQAHWSRQLGIESGVVETPNGFAAAELIPEVELRWRTEGPVRLIYWGRLDLNIKGLDLLIQAFERLRCTVDARLVLQGPDWFGDGQAVVDFVRKSSAVEHIEIRPPVFDQPAARVLGEHDIVCTPSRFEGFGLATLDAMLAARVALVTESAGITPYVVESGCGTVVTPDVDAIHGGLLALIQKRADWRVMGLRGRTCAVESLNWNAIANRTLNQYRHLFN
jgi:glycosyltransferase involved in cell wall biosynthesis